MNRSSEVREREGTPPAPPGVDPVLVGALEEYLHALEAGTPVDRGLFAARFPGLGDLDGCLDGLELMHAAAAAGRGQQPPTPAGVPLGDFRMLREIGRGGMGVVYEAEQLSLGRRVALKVLPLAAALEPRQLQRFKLEAQAAANLHHAHIVPVFAVGCDRGVHYYAMQLIDGRSLADVVRDLRGSNSGEQPDDKAVSRCRGVGLAGATTVAQAALPTEAVAGRRDYFRWVARLTAQAAEALDYAHQTGVIHRDIKPANLLLDARGDLWVTDFGLAQVGGVAGATVSGDLLGTLRYMSPEQALGRRGVVDHRTDVYSLGVTLYELLTLEPAVPGDDREAVLRAIGFGEPPSTRLRNPSVPRELDIIVAKAAAKEPADRYATASEFAEDLRRFLADEPIRARPPSPLQRARRWSRRHRPVVVGLVTALALLAVAGLVMLAGYARQQGRLATDRQRMSREADARLFRTLLDHASAIRHARAPGYRAEVWEELAWAVALDVPEPDLSRVRAIALACLGDPLGLGAEPNPETLPRRPVAVRSATVRGQRYAVAPASTAGTWSALGDHSGKVRWRGADGKRTPMLATMSPLGPVHDLEISPDASLLAAGCEEGLCLWDLPTLSRHGWFRGGSVYSVAFHPNSRLVAAAGRQLELWSAPSNRLVAVFPPPGESTRVEFSADGRSLLALLNGRVAAAWPVRDTPEKRVFDGHRRGAPAVAFSPDGRCVASGSKDLTVKLWDSSSGALLHDCAGHQAEVEAVAFSPDGRLLASGDFAGTVIVWRPDTGEAVARWAPAAARPPGQVWRLHFSGDGVYLAAGGAGGVAVWRVRAGPDVAIEPCASDSSVSVQDIALCPSGKTLAVLTRSGELYRRGLEEDSPLERIPVGPRAEVRSLHFIPTGDRLVFINRNGFLSSLDWGNGETTVTARKALQLALCPDGRWAATSNAARGVVVCDAGSGEELITLPPESGDVWGLAWSPDGSRLAVSLSDGAVAVWSLEEVRARLAEFGVAPASTVVGSNTLSVRSARTDAKTPAPGE